MKRFVKRLGALCLCTVLLLGPFHPALAAEKETRPTLTDLDQCVHREAVILMGDLGVISGKSDGTFAPNETIDRASMAKLIYSIMMGSTDPQNFLGVKTDLTDVKGTWAEGYINYCYSVGIISGNKGRFMPDGKVTVDAAAKMLLVTAGYDAKKQGYEGEKDWAENIRRDATALGLFFGITQEGTEELTRDNAAKMIYNALFANVRTPIIGIADGEMMISGYKTEPETLGMRTFGLVKCVLTVTKTVPDSSRVTLTLASVEPKGAVLQDEKGLVQDIALGRAAFQLGPEWENESIAVYFKADYTIQEGVLRQISLQDIYSTEAIQYVG